MRGQAVARGVCVGFLALASVYVAGCADPLSSGVPAPPPANEFRATTSSNLAPGDVVAISFPGLPEQNTTQKIRANGRVSLPLIGDVRAAGKSVSSFQSELGARYKKHLQEPSVVVAVERAAAAVYVSGAVGQPGKLPLERPLTALEAVMEAGGFAPTANPRKVSLVRTANGVHQRYTLDMTDPFSQRTNAFYLKPFDVIYVTPRTW